MHVVSSVIRKLIPSQLLVTILSRLCLTQQPLYPFPVRNASRTSGWSFFRFASASCELPVHAYYSNVHLLQCAQYCFTHPWCTTYKFRQLAELLHGNCQLLVPYTIKSSVNVRGANEDGWKWFTPVPDKQNGLFTDYTTGTVELSRYFVQRFTMQYIFIRIEDTNNTVDRVRDKQLTVAISYFCQLPELVSCTSGVSEAVLSTLHLVNIAVVRMYRKLTWCSCRAVERPAGCSWSISHCKGTMLLWR